MKILAAVCLSLSLMLITKMSYTECGVVDHGDRMEVICTGEPLTEAQKKDAEKVKADTIKLEAAKEEKIKAAIVPQTAAPSPQNNILSAQKKEEPEIGSVEVQHYDLKYVPYDSRSATLDRRLSLRQAITIGGTLGVDRRFGEYSIKIVAKNIGRRGTVKFKLKQTDFSGFETESITFSEDFEQDQSRTVTTLQPATQVPFIRTNDWTIETYKY